MECIQEQQQVKLIPCPLCSKAFGSRRNLTWHVSKYHKGNDFGLSRERSKMVSCSLCGKRFTRKFCLVRHCKAMHGTSLDTEPKHETATGKVYTCGVCNKSFPRKSALQRHLANIHHAVDSALCTKTIKRACYPCPVCSIVLKSVFCLPDHFAKVHPEEPSMVQNLSFATEADFRSWKCEEEKATNSLFVKRYRNRVCAIRRYFCHRSGSYQAKGTGKRRLKRQGSCKIGSMCTAFIKATSLTTGIAVAYSSNHTHPTEAQHIGLTEMERSQIAEMITAGMDLTEIREKICEDVSSTEITRLHLLRRKDLLNIATEFHLPHSSVVKDKSGTKRRRRADKNNRKDDGDEEELDAGSKLVKVAPRPQTARSAQANIDRERAEVDELLNSMKVAIAGGDRQVIGIAKHSLRTTLAQIYAIQQQAGTSLEPVLSAPSYSAEHYNRKQAQPQRRFLVPLLTTSKVAKMNELSALHPSAVETQEDLICETMAQDYYSHENYF